MSQNLNDQQELFKIVSDYCDRIAKIPQYDFSKFGDLLAPWEKTTKLNFVLVSYSAARKDALASSVK